MEARQVPRYNSINEAVKALFGENAAISNRQRISGGDINEAYSLTLSNGMRIFMKSNSIRNSCFFSAESLGLSALAAPAVIGVPKILCTGTDRSENISFLMLEMIEAAPRIKDYWEVFGEELSSLHGIDASEYVINGKYGFIRDNYIGMRPQDNSAEDSWVDFFRLHRLKPQFEAASGYFDAALIKRINTLLDRLGDILIEPEAPSLLHGDMWAGNVIAGSDGKAWLIDPAVYVGHREVDLAMSELFGGFSGRFYSAYEEAAPLEPGYDDRREIYNLYQLLNHLNMFGASYLSSVVRTVTRFT